MRSTWGLAGPSRTASLCGALGLGGAEGLVRSMGHEVRVIQPGSVSTDMQECTDDEKAEAIANHEMLYAEELAEAILFALTRSERALKQL